MLVPLDRLGAAPAPFRVEPGPAVREALARRFGLLSLDRLEAELAIRRTAQGAEGSGKIAAGFVQACVVSGEPVAGAITETVSIRFEPEPQDSDIELDPAALDTFPLEGASIDLGEAVAQLLAAALDPWPRASDEVLAAARSLLQSEEDAASERAASGPFAALGKG
jgi:hypothetical protein